jgi:hypothetical protein
VGHALVARARVGEGDAQRRDRAAAQGGGRVDRLAGGDAGVAPPRAGAEVARSLGDDRDVRADGVPGGQETAVHRDRLEVAAERLAGRDRRRQPAGRAQAGDRAGEPRGKRPAVRHHVGDAGKAGRAGGKGIIFFRAGRPGTGKARQDRRKGRMEVGHHHGHSVDGVGRFEQFVVLGPLLVGAFRHHLQGRIPGFHDMTGNGGIGRQAIRYRHHQRIAARAEPGLQRGDVQQHPVADERRSDQRGVRERANRVPVHGYHKFCGAGPFSPQRRHCPAPPSDHDGRLAAGGPRRGQQS